jgi:hypothetical protein
VGHFTARVSQDTMDTVYIYCDHVIFILHEIRVYTEDCER